ncbi:hypothetical protein, partial [Actinomadura sp. NPDC049753]|uniref:hypothetical protein n=1 Tax=Actinomadura sp. NPDC049753 TaxID=3154739 RepID=UPI003426461D
RKGKLVLARGYTWSVDAALSVQPTSLFRPPAPPQPLTAGARRRPDKSTPKPLSPFGDEHQGVTVVERR